jgi:hypothetical protein
MGRMSIQLTSSEHIDLVTSSTANVDVIASWVDLVIATGAATPGLTCTAISSATTTQIVAAPASGTVRKISEIRIRNKHASSSNTITLNVHGAAEYQWDVCTLAAGSGRVYNAVLDATPNINIGYHPGVLGTAGCKGSTHDRALIVETNTTLTTTGQVYMQAIWLAAGTVVSNIKIWSATTAAGTPTHCNAGLYDSSGNRLATGTDLTSTAWAANSLRTFTMQSPYTVTTTGVYYIAYSTVATTCPTIKGTTARAASHLALTAPLINGVSGTAYATGDMPATLVLPAAAVTTGMYAEVS